MAPRGVRTRMLDKSRAPTEEEMRHRVGRAREAWDALRAILGANYPDVVPEIHYAGAKYGWEVRYRKGGRPLVSLFPEEDGFTSLVVLGRAEAAKAEAIVDRLSPAMQALLADAAQLHDGRWLWVRWPEDGTVEDVGALVRLKRRPRTPYWNPGRDPARMSPP